MKITKKETIFIELNQEEAESLTTLLGSLSVGVYERMGIPMGKIRHNIFQIFNELDDAGIRYIPEEEREDYE